MLYMTREQTPWSRQHLEPPQVYYRVKKCLSLSILSQMNPLCAPHPISLIPILILSSHVRLGLPGRFITSGFPTKTCMRVSVMRVHTLPVSSSLISCIAGVRWAPHWRS
jgi:hypothetical protein